MRSTLWATQSSSQTKRNPSPCPTMDENPRQPPPITLPVAGGAFSARPRPFHGPALSPQTIVLLLCLVRLRPFKRSPRRLSSSFFLIFIASRCPQSSRRFIGYATRTHWAAAAPQEVGAGRCCSRSRAAVHRSRAGPRVPQARAEPPVNPGVNPPKPVTTRAD